MKFLYFSLVSIALVIGFSNTTFGQCVPNENFNGLYSPTVEEGLPSGLVFVPYSAVITVNVPTDTTYATLTVQIDSMVLESVSGLPPDFSYVCSPPSCSFPSGERGCIKVSGTASTNDHAHDWDLDADFTFYIKQPAITLPYTISDYTITLDSVPLGVEETPASVDLLFTVTPNPVVSESEVRFELPQQTDYTIEVISLLGAQVFSRQATSNAGVNTANIPSDLLTNGVYFAVIRQEGYVKSARFIVQK